MAAWRHGPASSSTSTSHGRSGSMAEVCISVVFPQPIAAGWAVLRDFNSISSWLPGAQNGAIESGLADQIGAVRRFQLGVGGPLVRERLLALSDRDHCC